MAQNYIRNVGKLATDRYDFQNHVDGYNNNHAAGAVNLSPSIVINGNTHTTVQSALTEIAPFATTIPDATASVKGIIKLSGDLSGSATSIIASASKIQNRTVVATAPTSGQVLTWNASGYWEPAAASIFAGGNDLSATSTATSQDVIGITGTAGFCNIKCLGLRYSSSVTTPLIDQASTSSGSGQMFRMHAQSSTVSYGGNLYLSSGSGNSPSYKAGSLYLQCSAGAVTMLQIVEPNVVNNIILSLCGTATITNMPSGTGNKVIFVKDATTVPTVSPSGGSILYSTSGALWVKESGGKNFKINNDNKIVFQHMAYAPNNSSTLGGWNSFNDTTSEDYMQALFTDSYAVEVGDIVKVTFTGYVSNSSSDAGYVTIRLAGGLGETYMYGGEIFVDLPTTDPSHFTLNSIHTITVQDTVRAEVCMKADSDAAGTMYMYGGATLTFEVIRP